MVTRAADALVFHITWYFITLLLYPFYSTTFADFSHFVVYMLLDVKAAE